MPAPQRDARGRFAPKPRDQLSPAYRQRVERGLHRGRSLGQARGHGTRARAMWTSRGVAVRPSYGRALEALRQMRQGKSLTRAARDTHVAPETVRRYAGAALTRDPRGHLVARPTDHLYRKMRFLDEEGLTWVEVANAREASKLARYWSAVDHYLRTGDAYPLRRFARMRLRTRQRAVRRFVTDRALLDRFAVAGQISFEDLYALTA